MTDRVNALVVTLDHDVRIDDVEALRQAIAQLRGVIDVSPNVSQLQDHIALVRARHHLSEKLWAVLFKKPSEKGSDEGRD